MRVRAKRMGYYQNRRVREGEEFELFEIAGKKKLSAHKYEDIVLKPADQFSDNWMEKIDSKEEKPKKEKERKPVSRADEDVI